MGSFGLDRELAMAGYEGIKDPLSETEKAEIIVNNDKDAIEAPWFVVRDSVFSVLNMQGQSEIS